MNVLITGGNGFLASYLKNSLSNQYNVYALSKSQLNCLDPKTVDHFFNTHSIDVVIHTALTGRENLFDNDTIWLSDSLIMWRNFYNNQHKFKKLIQFGSAYELPLDKDQRLITFKNILEEFPIPSYGYAKNIIARNCNEIENFYNLRIFGNFHYTEKDIRFFKTLYRSSNFVINEDRYFDYFNLEDISTVVKHVIKEFPVQRDINLVYKEKYSLLEQVKMFCEVNKINPTIEIKKQGFEITGDSKILDSFKLNLKGLIKGFEQYRQNL